MVLTLTVAWAQTNPNRVLVHEASGNVKGFLVERVDSMSFAKVEGRVAADAGPGRVEVRVVRINRDLGTDAGLASLELRYFMQKI